MWSSGRKYPTNPVPGLEVYEGAPRFIIMTGDLWNPLPTSDPEFNRQLAYREASRMTSATEKSIKELYPLVMDEFDRDPAKAPQTASAIPKPAAVPQPTNPVTITKEKASIARHEPQVNSEPDALTEYLSSLTQERQREIQKYSNLPESDLEIPTEKRAAAILTAFHKKHATVPKGQRNTPCSCIPAPCAAAV